MSAEVIPIAPAPAVPPASAATPDAPAQLAAVLHFVRVHNALMPSTARETRTLPWVHLKPVKGYLDDVFPESREDLAVSLNGRIVAAEDQEHVLPRAGDWLIVSPAIEGGSTWRTLAQVAVMAAAIAASVFLGPEFVALGWASSAAIGSVMAGVAAGLISVGGNMLINAFMGLTPASKSEQPSWAFSGPQTLAQPGVVIPKGYGTFMGGGNIISSFVDLEGTDQYINALVCYGFGPARSIGQIQINGKDIGTYSDVQYQVRYGTNDQAPISAFNRIVNGYPQETQVTVAGGPVVVPGTGDLTQALQVDIEFATGCFYISGDGNQLPLMILYIVEYAVSGTNDWLPVLSPNQTQDVVQYNPDGTVNWGATPTWVLVWTGGDPASGVVLQGDNGPHSPGDQESVTQTVTTYNYDGTSSTSSQTFQGEWQPIDVTVNQVEVLSWWNGVVNYTNDTTEVVYNRTSIYGLAPNKYDVQVTKIGSYHGDGTDFATDDDNPKKGQEVWIHSVNEITYQDMCYPNMILVGVRALATNQLSGANINITAVIEYGLRTLDNNILPAALQAYEENNPACVAADMMLDPLYGGGAYPGIQPPNIERFIDEWVAWAELADTLVPDGNGNSIRLAPFNGIFDNEDNLWNQLQAVGRMSRAVIIPMGRDYGVFVNQVDVPVQMFSMGNIIQDSHQKTWLALDDRANQVEVEFADSTRYYRTDNPIVYMSPEDQEAGAIVKNTRIRGTGITIPAQAWHFGHFLGLCNELLLRTGKFETDVDGIACRPGNLIILQHDVPQWGWGGRTLPGATTTSLPVDRNDLPWDGTTAYNVIVLFPSILRYSGNVTAANPSVDSTGLTVGTLLNLSSFDNANRVTRAVVAGVDCPILSSSPGQVLVTLPPGFTPASGQAYQLFDTDVLETATVANAVPAENNTMLLALGTAFSQPPADFSVYFYGPPGSQKIVRVTSIKKTSDFKASIEWIDYDPDAYAVVTPVVGETSAQTTTEPGVSNLTATEIFTQQGGSYIDYVSLSWANGPNTAGVAIFGSYPGSPNKLLVRLTGTGTSWQYQVAPGVAWTFTVVGFDANNNYAAISTAPSVQFTADGITQNLLRSSSFQTGFAYWNTSPRAGDSLTTTLSNDGQAVYTVAGSAVAVPLVILNQVIPTADWSVGTLLMLSAYFTAAGTPTGNLVADICFQNSAGTIISTARAVLALTGAAVTLTRVNCTATAVPAGTVQVVVRILFDGSTLNLPVGTVITADHLLLEVADTGQTAPSIWADLDVKGNVLDVFQAGSSSSLRTQASALPVLSGAIGFSLTTTSAAFDWSSLQIKWPDGGITYVQDGALAAVTGLNPGTKYYGYVYWDVVNAQMVQVASTIGAVGTPALLGTAYDATADGECKQDGRISLTPGGLSFTTPSSGTMTGSGGGAGGGGYYCTVRGTILQTSIGPVRNERVKMAFDLATARGSRILLRTPTGRLEAIASAQWVTVDHYYRVEVEGFTPFGCSAAHALYLEGETLYRACSEVPTGSRVATGRGYLPARITRVDHPAEVLAIHMAGPEHEYLVVEGVRTHNKPAPPVI